MPMITMNIHHQIILLLVIFVQTDALFTKKTNHVSRRKMQDAEDFRIGIVRVEANDTSVDINEATLSDAFFGDGRTLRTFVSECSLGNAGDVVPIEGNSDFTNGVATYTTSSDILGSSALTLGQEVFDSFFPDGSSVSADAIIVCIPDGLFVFNSLEWYVNSPEGGELAIIQESYCEAVQSQAYVYGVKFGMDKFVLDPSQIFNERAEDAQLCFNSPDTDKVGWYSDYTLVISRDTGFRTTVELIGMGDVVTAEDDDVAIVKLQADQDNCRFFVQLNVASGLTTDMFVDGVNFRLYGTELVTPLVSVYESFVSVGTGANDNILLDFYQEGAQASSGRTATCTVGGGNALGWRIRNFDTSSTPTKATVDFFVCGFVCKGIDFARYYVTRTACFLSGALCFN